MSRKTLVCRPAVSQAATQQQRAPRAFNSTKAVTKRVVAAVSPTTASLTVVSRRKGTGNLYRRFARTTTTRSVPLHQCLRFPPSPRHGRGGKRGAVLTLGVVPRRRFRRGQPRSKERERRERQRQRYRWPLRTGAKHWHRLLPTVEEYCRELSHRTTTAARLRTDEVGVVVGHRTETTRRNVAPAYVAPA